MLQKLKEEVKTLERAAAAHPSEEHVKKLEENLEEALQEAISADVKLVRRMKRGQA